MSVRSRSTPRSFDYTSLSLSLRHADCGVSLAQENPPADNPSQRPHSQQGVRPLSVAAVPSSLVPRPAQTATSTVGPSERPLSMKAAEEPASSLSGNGAAVLQPQPSAASNRPVGDHEVEINFGSPTMGAPAPPSIQKPQDFPIDDNSPVGSRLRLMHIPNPSQSAIATQKEKQRSQSRDNSPAKDPPAHHPSVLVERGERTGALRGAPGAPTSGRSTFQGSTTLEHSALGYISPNVAKVRDWETLSSLCAASVAKRRALQAENPATGRAMIIGGGSSSSFDREGRTPELPGHRSAKPLSKNAIIAYTERSAVDGKPIPPDPKELYLSVYQDIPSDEQLAKEKELERAMDQIVREDLQGMNYYKNKGGRGDESEGGNPCSVSAVARAAERHRQRRQEVLLAQLEGRVPEPNPNLNNSTVSIQRGGPSVTDRSLLTNSFGTGPQQGGVEGQPPVPDRPNFLDAHQDYIQQQRLEYYKQQEAETTRGRTIAGRGYSEKFVHRLLTNNLQPPEPAVDEVIFGKNTDSISRDTRVVILPPNSPAVARARYQQNQLQGQSYLARTEAQGSHLATDSSFTREFVTTPSGRLDPMMAVAPSASLADEVAKCWSVKPKIVPPTGWNGRWQDCRGHEMLLYHMDQAGVTAENSPELVDWAMQPQLLSCVQRLSYGTHLIDYSNAGPARAQSSSEKRVPSGATRGRSSALRSRSTDRSSTGGLAGGSTSVGSWPQPIYAMIKNVLVEEKGSKGSSVRSSSPARGSSRGRVRKYVPCFCWSRNRHDAKDEAQIPLLEVIGVTRTDRYTAYIDNTTAYDEGSKVRFLRGPKAVDGNQNAEVSSHGTFSVFLLSGRTIHLLTTDPLVHNLWFEFFDRIGELNGAMELSGEVKARRRELQRDDAEFYSTSTIRNVGIAQTQAGHPLLLAPSQSDPNASVTSRRATVSGNYRRREL